MANVAWVNKYNLDILRQMNILMNLFEWFASLEYILIIINLGKQYSCSTLVLTCSSLQTESGETMTLLRKIYVPGKQ